MPCILQRLSRVLALIGALASGSAAEVATGSVFGNARPAMRVYGVEDGLPGTSIYALTLDSKGRLWAGTMEGPAFHAGAGWTAVPLPSECPSRFVRAILESEDGSLWFGTEGGGLWRLKDRAWTGFRAGRELRDDRVNCLLETRSSTGRPVLWAGTAGGGISRLEDGRWTLQDRTSGLKDDWVWKLREIREPDGSLRIWAATQKGLSVLHGARWKSIGPEQGFRGTSCNDVVSVEEAAGKRAVWVSCWELGLARWDGTRWAHFGPAEGFPSRYPACLSVTAGAEGKPVLWAGTFNGGLLWKAGGAWQSLGVDQGFPAIGAFAILPVPRGKPDVWIGTRGGGVASMDLGGWRTLDEKLGLPSLEASCFAEATGPDGKRIFWIGTNRGVSRWEDGRLAAEGGITYVNHLLAVAKPDGAYVLWAATLEGLFKRDGGAWTRVGKETGLPEAQAIRLLEVEEPSGRTLWLGSQKGLGCLRNGRWRMYTTAEGLPHDWVKTLLATKEPDGSAVLWVGTRGGGVGRLKNGRWSTWGAAQGLPNQNVYGLQSTRTKDGRLWIWAATAGGGLARLDATRADARWEAFSTRNLPLLPSDSLMGLELDRAGRLYLTTPKGVARATLEEQGGAPSPARVETFTMGDGLPSLTCMINSTFLDRDGRLWVGTAKGAAVLDPDLETQPPPPPVPVLDRMEVMGKTRQMTPGESFGFRDQRIAFDFSVRAFHRREDAHFRTQLVGLEAEPTQWRKEGRRELTALPAGSYVLRVWAMDFARRESGPVEFPFVVRAAPWRTPWAYAIYAATLAAAILLFLRTRTRHLRRRTLELAAAVADRTQTVERQRRDLEEANMNLQGLNQNLQEMNEKNETLIREMAAALEEVKALRGFIPICAYCKKIRDDQGYWAQLEAYVSQHTGARFSHGICPACQVKVQAELDELKQDTRPLR